MNLTRAPLGIPLDSVKPDHALGFFLRGEGLHPTYSGHLSTPGTFGAMGAGTTNFWVDPVRNMTMVCLTTGFLEEANSALRFQRLSDVAIAEFA